VATIENAKPHQLRECEHLRGKCAFQQGDWETARMILENSVKVHGPHVGTLSDLAACYYLLGRRTLWERALERFEAEFILAKELLSANSRKRSTLSLAKFFEERGEIAKAISYYREIAADPTNEETENIRYTSQILRLHAYLGNKNEIATYYRQLLGYSADQNQGDILIEVEHSLILAEAHLVSMSLASQRLKRLNARTPLSSYDLRLTYFDLLEVALILNATSEIVELEPPRGDDELDAFERTLLRIRDGSFGGSAELLEVAGQMAPFTFFRLLNLLSTISSELNQREIYRSQLRFLLHGLDRESQALLRQRVGVAPEAGTQLTLYGQAKALEYGGITLSFAGKKIPFAILEHLAARTSLKLEELVQLVWGSEMNDSFYHRVRVNVKRLNDDIEKSLNIPSAVQLGDGKVKLAPGILMKVS
jgi:tetratricopeptide (TPR) repeat protein